jgi:hypothetical protein
MTDRRFRCPDWNGLISPAFSLLYVSAGRQGRQRAADAKDRAGQAKYLSIKSAVEHVAAGWAAPAELKRSGSTGRSFHYATKKAARHIPGAQAEDSPAMGEFLTSTATDTGLIALGEQLEGLLREYMDAWLEWAPRMRAAHAEAKDNTSALAVAIQRTGCDVAQERMSELEHDMQPLAEEIIAAPVTSLGGLRAKALVALLGGASGHGLASGRVRFPGRITVAVRSGRRHDRPIAAGARARGSARGRCGIQGRRRIASQARGQPRE